MPRMHDQMLHPVTFRTLALVACGWLLAGDALALTLGRARGAALIGRPLELVVPVTLDSSETQGPCAGADLFYGEERVRAPTVRWEPGIGMQGVVRITSPVPVDEPMVTVYLRVGCEQASSRRFVLLSELAPENAQSSVVPPVVPAAAPRASADAPGSRPAAVRVPAATRPVRASAAVPKPRVQRTALAQPQARLKLEPLDLAIDRDPILRLSSDIRTQPAAEPQQRQAAAALWQVLQRGPEETVQEALRLQGVERELKSLHDVTRQNVALIREMRGRVDQAEAGRRTASLLVLALALALAAVLAWFALRWYRVRQVDRVGRWFELHGEAARAAAAAAAETGPLPLAPLPPATAATAATAAKKAVAPPVIPAPSPIAATGAAVALHADDLQASRGTALRMVGVEELIDVHDKADFFLSIGETEQALGALEAHVHDQVETGALAWMHLLDLYHSLGRRPEYERVRAEFARRSGVQVPDFEHFDEAGAPLESHGGAVSRIVALWPSQPVLEVIEESIFRKPGLPGAEPFTLEAYRELVLLYHIAKEMLAVEQPKVPPVVDERERLMIPPASSRLGVDIDLEEPPPDRIAAQGLDFDFSAYDDITVADPARKRG